KQGDAQLSRRREMVVSLRNRVDEAIAQLVFGAPPSEAPFMWMGVPGMTSLQLTAAFQRAGVIVFPGSVLGDAEHVRVSLKSVPATDRLLAVLPELVDTTA